MFRRKKASQGDAEASAPPVQLVPSAPPSEYGDSADMYADEDLGDVKSAERAQLVEEGLAQLRENNELREQIGLQPLRVPRRAEFTPVMAHAAMDEKKRLEALWSAQQISSQMTEPGGFVGAGALMGATNIIAGEVPVPEMMSGATVDLPMVPRPSGNARGVPEEVRMRGAPLRLHCSLRGPQPIETDTYYRTYIRQTHVYCMCVINGLLAASTSDRTVKVWEPQNWTCVVTLNWPTEVIIALADVDGMLACASRDGSVMLWSMVSWECVGKLPPSTHIPWGMAPFGGKLATTADTTVCMWTKRRKGFKRTSSWDAHDDTILCMKSIEGLHGAFLVTGGADNNAKVWRGTRKCVAELVGHASAVTCIEQAGTQYLATGSEDTNVCIWFTSSWTLMCTLVGHSSFICSMIAHNGLFFTSSADKRLKLWDVHTWEIVDNKDCGSEVVTALQCIDGRLVTGMDNGTIKVWEV